MSTSSEITSEIFDRKSTDASDEIKFLREQLQVLSQEINNLKALNVKYESLIAATLIAHDEGKGLSFNEIKALEQMNKILKDSIS